MVCCINRFGKQTIPLLAIAIVRHCLRGPLAAKWLPSVTDHGRPACRGQGRMVWALLEMS
jgi:hypothetical protein